MTERIPQSTSKTVLFKAYLSSDHVSEATSKTIAITISKNKAAFGNPHAGATNATEISNGWYYVDLDTTDTGTLGPLAVRGAVSGIDDVGVLLTVVSANNGGLAALPDVASGSAGGVIVQGTGTTGLLVSSGHVSNVDTLTTYTGNTLQTGDSFARIGAAGAGLTALGDTRIEHLDADVSGRMATYTQPTGFLAATFSGTVASTTNITSATGIDVTKWLGGAIPAVNVTGVPLVDAKYLLGTVFSTPTVAGIPNVNAKTWNDLATVELPLVPTTAGRKLDVSTGGEAGLDWANVGSPTTSLALTGTTISTTQKVDVETIKTNAVVNAGTLTFPSGATLASTTNITAATGIDATKFAGQTITAAAGVTLPASVASPTNITAGTITTVTNLTNAPTSGDFTSAMKTSLNAATPASVVGAVGSVTGLTASDVGAIKAKTDNLPTAPADESLIIAATSSLATSIAALPTTTTVNAIKAKTDNLPASPAATSDIPTAAQNRAEMDSNSTKLAHLDADVSSRSTFAGGAVASVTGNVGGNVVGTVAGVVGLNTALVDAAISSRLPSSSYTAPDNSDIVAIKAKTDNLPASPADEALILAATGALAASIAALPPTTTVNAIKAQTDKLAFTLDNQVDANIRSVNDVTVSGDGSAGSEWGPA